jgi:hypothetical protein
MHDCAGDRYRGQYRALGEDCWTLIWHITGPRKQLSLATLFSRMTSSYSEPSGSAP